MLNGFHIFTPLKLSHSLILDRLYRLQVANNALSKMVACLGCVPKTNLMVKVETVYVDLPVSKRTINTFNYSTK